jgi:outer membrane protein TolC
MQTMDWNRYSGVLYVLGWLACLLCCAPALAAKKPPKRVLPSAGKPLTCPQAALYALRHNPSFRATRANALVALRRLNASRVFPTNPELETLGKGKSKSAKWAPYQFSVELTWKFPIGGHWTARQQAVKATYERVKSEVEVAGLYLALKVEKTCFTLLLEEQKVLLYQGMLSFYQRVFGLVSKRKKSGAATAIEVNLARLELLQTRASLTQAKGEVKALQRALAAQLGWTRPGLPPLRHKLVPYLQVRQTVSQLQARGLRRHVVLRMLDLKIKEADATLRWARAKAIPDLKIKLYYAFEEGDAHTIGGGIAIPLPFLWRNQSKVWTTRAKLRQARLKRRAMLFKIRQHIAEVHTRFQAGRRVFELYEKQLIPTLQQQLKLRIRGLRLGAFTILQVISAQQSQNKAMLKRLGSLNQVMSAYIQLQKALGGLL